MINLTVLSPHHVAPPTDNIYLSKESSTDEKRRVYSKGSSSYITREQKHYGSEMKDFYSGHQSHIGAINLGKTILGQSFGMPPISLERGIWSPPKSPTASDILSLIRREPILTDEIIIVPIREIPRDYAKKDIAEYIQRAGGRKVYISELAEELRLDIELIMEIMEELEAETRD